MAHPYDSVLERVENPARYVGGEYRARRAVTGPDPLRVVLAFPDTYEVGSSHIGLQILHDLLDRDPIILADRVFTPWPDMEAALRETGLPLLTLDGRWPVGDADVLGISLLYELTYTNVLTILDLAGLPLRSENRDEDAPLVIAGGPVASHAEPVAPFVDAMLLGDAEDALPPLLASIRRLRRAHTPRAALLRQLAEEHPGLYVPSLHPPQTELAGEGPATVFSIPSRQPDVALPAWPIRRQVADITKHPLPTDGPVPLAEAVFDRVSIEVARGCQQGCRFCQAGILYRPVRERSPADVARTALEGTALGGYNETSLASLSTADYRGLDQVLPALMSVLADRRIAVAVSSLRAYGLSDGLLDEIARVRKTGLTLAAEAGTDRLRRVINKNVTEEELLDAVRRAAQRGWRRVKLYFMCGLPTETDDDLRAIIALGDKVASAGRKAGRGRRLEVTVSVSNHVPKPHTPFQWEEMDGPRELARKHTLLREEARRRRVKLKLHGAAMSVTEGVMARGDRRLADVIEAAWRAGARFDGWDEGYDDALWQAAYASLDIDPATYLAAIPVDAALPWDYCDSGVTRSFLVRERARALDEAATLACGLHDAEASADHRARCFACGLDCDLAFPELSEDLDEQRAALDKVLATAKMPPLAAGDDDVIVRYRFRYEKRETARYLGQIDMMRHILRNFSRAGLRISYSQGFHPHPHITFAATLPLGAEALGDFIDVLAVDDPRSDDELLRALDATAITGVAWRAVRRQPRDSQKITRLVRVVDHALRLSRLSLSDTLGVPGERVERALTAVLDAWRGGDDPLLITIVRKGKARELDLRPVLLGCCAEALVAPYIDRLRESDDDVLVGLRFALEGAGLSVRPAEWLAAVLPNYDGPLRAVRTALWGRRDDDTLIDPVGPLEPANPVGPTD